MKAMDVLVPAGLALAFVVGGLVLPDYYQDVLSRIFVLAILAVSMELVLGTTGLVSFGQAAFFGVGAYAVVVTQQYTGMTSVAAMAAVAISGALLLGLVIGALSLRTKDIYFLMVTLAFAQMVYHVAHDTPLVGGSDGKYLNSPLRLPFLGDLEGSRAVYFACLAGLAAAVGLTRTVLASKFGRALRGIGSNEKRMRAMGYQTYLYKLAAFTMSAGVAGLAGFLYCVKNGSVSPEMMSWQQSGLVLVMVIIGGIGRLWGAVAGAALYVMLEEALSSPALVGGLADHWLLLLGMAIIVIVAAWPHGLAGFVERTIVKTRLARRTGGAS